MLSAMVKTASARGRLAARLQPGAHFSSILESHAKQLTSLVEWASLREPSYQQASSAYHQADQSARQLTLIQPWTVHKSIHSLSSRCLASRDVLKSDSATPSGEPTSNEVLHAGTTCDAADSDDLDEEEKVQQIEDAHLAESMERLIMEAYILMQSGDMQQAESLLLEGAQAIEAVDEGMGDDSNHPCQAQLRDQLSLFQFLQGKLPEAEANARRSLSIIQNHFPAADPAVCMCQLRLGSIIFSMGRYQEARDLITSSYEGLRQGLGDKAQAVGESQYYLALLPLLTATSEAAVAQTDPMLLQGLWNMRSTAGAGRFLVQAALREHNRLVDAQLTSQNWDKAAWLFRQEIRLRNGVEPGSEALCLLLYQFATLQYTRGEFVEAEALAQFSLDVALSAHKNEDNQIMLRKHRLGTILDCTDQAAEAEMLLNQSYQHFDKRLGPKNPLTGEAQFALALAGVRQMVNKSQTDSGLDPYSKVLAPQKKQDLVQRMQKGLQAMQAGFGADHMLVKKALKDYDHMSAMLRRV